MLALYIIVGIILIMVLALLIPMEMTFDLETSGDRKARTRVGWLFGLAITLFGLGTLWFLGRGQASQVSEEAMVAKAEG